MHTTCSASTASRSWQGPTSLQLCWHGLYGKTPGMQDKVLTCVHHADQMVNTLTCWWLKLAGAKVHTPGARALSHAFRAHSNQRHQAAVICTTHILRSSTASTVGPTAALAQHIRPKDRETKRSQQSEPLGNGHHRYATSMFTCWCLLPLCACMQVGLPGAAGMRVKPRHLYTAWHTPHLLQQWPAGLGLHM